MTNHLIARLAILALSFFIFCGAANAQDATGPSYPANLPDTKANYILRFTDPWCVQNPNARILVDGYLPSFETAQSIAADVEKRDPARANENWAKSPLYQYDPRAKSFSHASEYFADRIPVIAEARNKVSAANLQTWCECAAGLLNERLTDDLFQEAAQPAASPDVAADGIPAPDTTEEKPLVTPVQEKQFDRDYHKDIIKQNVAIECLIKN